MRSDDEIRADLATPYWEDAVERLAADVPGLLAELARVTEERDAYKLTNETQHRSMATSATHLRNAKADLARYRAAVEAATALHKPHPLQREVLGDVRSQRCVTCRENWPCRTAAALAAAVPSPDKPQPDSYPWSRVECEIQDAIRGMRSHIEDAARRIPPPWDQQIRDAAQEFIDLMCPAVPSPDTDRDDDDGYHEYRTEQAARWDAATGWWVDE